MVYWFWFKYDIWYYYHSKHQKSLCLIMMKLCGTLHDGIRKMENAIKLALIECFLNKGSEIINCHHHCQTLTMNKIKNNNFHFITEALFFLFMLPEGSLWETIAMERGDIFNHLKSILLSIVLQSSFTVTEKVLWRKIIQRKFDTWVTCLSWNVNIKNTIWIFYFFIFAVFYDISTLGKAKNIEWKHSSKLLPQWRGIWRFCVAC